MRQAEARGARKVPRLDGTADWFPAAPAIPTPVSYAVKRLSAQVGQVDQEGRAGEARRVVRGQMDAIAK